MARFRMATGFMLVLLLMCNAIAIFGGLIDGEHRQERCASWPSARISYIAPGYVLGCWLGSPPSKSAEGSGS